MLSSHKLRRFSAVVSLVAVLFLFAFVLNSDVGHAQSAKDKALLIPVIPPGSAYRQRNLISDVPGLSQLMDPLLVNPWGITVRGTSPFWVANNGTSTTQLIRGDVASAPVTLNPNPQTITIPGGLPTGTVGNGTLDFQITPPGGGTPTASSFIFNSITGNITAWNAASGAVAQNVVSMPGHVWTGLAIGANAGGNRLYAADFANSHIDVFNGMFAATTVTGAFSDPTIPAGYAPFNIQNVGGSLFVMYAKVGPGGLAEAGVGFGYVRRFNTDGVRDLTFGINNGALNAPWGVAIAPASFGIFGGALLIGNFGEGNPSIHAFNPTTGAFLGTIQGESGDGIEIDELWALQFGNGGNGGDVNTLYFTAGVGEEEHGLFGKLNPTTSTATSLIQFASSEVGLSEAGGHADLTVIRIGDTSGPASVSFNTFDESQSGHASQKSDYEIALGRINFAPGESSKTVQILVVDDKFVEGDEVVDLYLSNPAGAGVGLGGPARAEVMIFEDDLTATTAHPIDSGPFFVRQQYLDVFNREPDGAAPALANQITACGFTRNCLRAKQVEIGYQFFTAPGYLNTAGLVLHTFKTAFGPTRSSSAGELYYGEFEEAIQAILKGDALTGGASLETNKQAFFNALTGRPDFQAKYPASLTNTQYVDLLITTSTMTFPAGFREQLISDLDTMTRTRSQVVRAIAEHPVFAADANRNLVLIGFFTFMRRDADTASFNLLLNRLNSITFDPLYDTVRIFLESPEYRGRFGSEAVPADGRVNNAPDAIDNATSTGVDSPIFINVVSNDVDPEADFLIITSVTAGVGGTPVINPDRRSIAFTPSPGFSGVASFQYTITDNGTRLFPFSPFDDPKSDTATVFVGVGIPTPSVSVEGRLYTPNGIPLARTYVFLTGPSTSLIARTSSFGYYRFDNITVGQTYTITAAGKPFSFTPRLVTVNDYITDVDLVASP